MPKSLLPKWLGPGALAACALTTLNAETFTLEEATIDQIQKAMADGALTSVELTSKYLNRIAIYDQNGIKFNSTPVIDPTAFSQAASADDTRASGGPLAKLNGIPIVLKDSFDVVGMGSSAGIAGWLDLLPAKDAFAVTKLRESGAIILGKGNMTSYGWSGSVTVSDLYGTTLNPYNVAIAPGGSSGGPAVAAAANLTAIAFGGEIGGSIRHPATRNNLFGLKTSKGLISVAGIVPIEFFLDVIGPFARNVSDVAYAMNATAKVDPADIWNPFIPVSLIQTQDYTRDLGRRSLAGVKLAIPKNYIGAGTEEYGENPTLDPDIATAFASARATLLSLGATVVEVDIPALKAFTESGPDFPENPDPYAYYNVEAGFSKMAVGSLKHYLAPFGANLVERINQLPESRLGAELIAGLAQIAADDAGYTFSSLPVVKSLDDTQTIYDNDYKMFMQDNGIDAFVFPTNASRNNEEFTHSPGVLPKN